MVLAEGVVVVAVAEVAVVEVVGEVDVEVEGDVVSILLIIFPASWMLMISEVGADCECSKSHRGRESVSSFDTTCTIVSFVCLKR